MTISTKTTRLSSKLIRLAGNKIAPRNPEDARLCIITYHRILEAPDPILESEPDVKSFRSQMEMLADCFNVLPLHDAMSALASGNLPPRAVCITFDDGYRSIHDLGLPILREFNLPATVFVMTGNMENGHMWNDEIIEVLRHRPAGQFDLRELGLGIFNLGQVQDRKDVIHTLIEKAKYLPSEERTEFVRRLSRLEGSTRAQNLMLTREMVARLANESIEIGAHTVSHPILTRMDDERARHEITACKMQLENITGKPVRYFAYPNGKAGIDFDLRHVRMAKEAGYAGAFTTMIGAAIKTHDKFQIPRSRPWDKTPFLFALRLLRWLSSSAA